MTPENTDLIQGKFKKGQSGNPAGKPRGARHRTTLAMQELLDGQAEALTQKAVELALKGDSTALRLCMERLLPVRKDCHLNFDLPDLTSAHDAARAIGAIAQEVANGKLTLMEATGASKLVGIYIEALKASELEARIEQLEMSNVTL